jgi:hypothetical protein
VLKHGANCNKKNNQSEKKDKLLNKVDGILLDKIFQNSEYKENNNGSNK